MWMLRLNIIHQEDSVGYGLREDSFKYHCDVAYFLYYVGFGLDKC